MSLRRRHALITGATSGLGQTLAVAARRSGAGEVGGFPLDDER